MAELDRVLIAGRIRKAREDAGLTQPEFGEALNPPVHWRTVQTWESQKDRRVPFGRLDEIARVAGTTKEWLLHGDATTQREDDVLEALRSLAARLERIEQQLDELQVDPPAVPARGAA